MDRHARVILLIALAASACGDDSSTDPEGVGYPSSLQIVSGDGQTGEVGSELPQPLVLKVLDRQNQLISGQTVTFRVTAGGGAVSSGSATTEEDGTAQVRWTLGTSTADSQRVEASVVGSATGEPLAAVFGANASPGPADNLIRSSGNGQNGPSGKALRDSLTIRVTDRYGNGVPDEQVQWTVAKGGGSVSPASGATDSSGYVRAEWVLGLRIDVAHEAEASVGDLAPVTFTASAVLPADAEFELVAGDGQSAMVATALGDSLTVSVHLADGRAVQGVVVRWTAAQGSGLTQPDSVLTDSQGRGRTEWRLGSTAGPQYVEATVVGLPSHTFTATALPGPVANLEVVAGDGQRAGRGSTLPDSLIVKASDAYGNKATGRSVNWIATAGGGTVSPSASTVDSLGHAKASWTLGPTPMTNTAEARADGLSIQFAAEALWSWALASTATSPPARKSPLVAYDATRNVTVLFGGEGTTGDLSDTWEFDGTTWTEVTTAVKPPALIQTYGIIFYNSARRVVSVFDLNGPGKDIWEYDGTDWTQLPVTGTWFPLRHSACGAYDSDRGRIVLFGGYISGHLSDTWEFQDTAWVQIATHPDSTPSPRQKCSMVYDSERKRVLLVGGVLGGALDDAWTFDGSGWTQVAIPAGFPETYWAGLSFNTATRTVFLTQVSETWEWNGTSWVRLEVLDSPGFKWMYGMDYNILLDRFVLFGENTYGDETWLLK